MKKIFTVAIIGLALLSCKKSSPPGIGTNGIQATIGNTTSIFNVLNTGSLSVTHNSSTDSVFNLQIYAMDNTNANLAHQFEISISSNQPLAIGTYSDTSRGHDFLDPVPLFRKASMDFSGYFNPFNTFIAYYSGSNHSAPGIVTITAISANSIQGTFQGPIYVGGDTTGLTKPVTNGKFIATYVNYN